MGEPARRRRRLRSDPATPALPISPAPGHPAPVSPAPVSPAPVSPAPGPPGGRVAMTARPAPTSGAGFGQVAARPGSAGAGPLPTGAAGAGRAAAPAGRSPTGGARQPPAGNGDDREAERGLRGLVGSGSSQVGVGAAIRARDAARPTEAHLAEAEERLVIVRRNWAPREDLPRR